MRVVVGVWAGAVLGFLAVIAWNTSWNTSALGGGANHLTFRASLLFVGLGGLIGGVIGEWFDTREWRRQHPPGDP